jgi:hypothetical protein
VILGIAGFSFLLLGGPLNGALCENHQELGEFLRQSLANSLTRRKPQNSRYAVFLPYFFSDLCHLNVGF